MKRFLMIAGFIVLTIVIAFLIYWFFFKQGIRPSTPETETETEEPGVLPSIGEAGDVNVISETSDLPYNEQIQQILQDQNIDTETVSQTARGGVTKVATLTANIASEVSISSDGTLRYYDEDTSRFYRVDSNGVAKLLSGDFFYGVENVTWSENQNKAILEYPDGRNIFYDFSTQKQYSLPDNWHDFSFDSTGDKIVFMNDDVLADNRWLAISSPDGSEVDLIEQVGENGDKVIATWSPNEQIVAFSQTGSPMGVWLQEIYALGKNNENFPSLVVNGRGFESKWSDDGSLLLYSVYNSDSNYNPTLWVTTAQGANLGATNVNLGVSTWAEKCTFDSSGINVYCAVPNSLETASGLFPEMSEATADSFYKINLETGRKNLIALPDSEVSVDELFISADNSELYFKNNITGLIEKVRLN